MQNYSKTIGALAAASALVAGNALAGSTTTTTTAAPMSTAAPAVNYELHAGYSSMYLFRGLDLGDNLVEVGADVSTELYGIGLSAGAWYGSFEGQTGYDNPVGDANADELDLYAEASKDFGFAKFAVGYIYYYYPQGTANKYLLGRTGSLAETYFSVSRDFGFVDASLTYYWDVMGEAYSNSGYTEVALSHSFELTPCLALDLNTNVGYEMDDNRFTAWTTKVALDWGFAEHAKLSPFVAASVGLTDFYNGSSDELVGGSMLSVSF